MHYPEWLRVDPADFQLAEVPTRSKVGPKGEKLDREYAEMVHFENLQALRALQFKMYAEHKRSLLVVLQAMDTGGKDGAIRKTFGALNPQGVRTKAFKKPTATELGHDFLWRIHQHAPGDGHIQIFNRSHYEDVLVVRVHDMVPEERWRARYEHIRNFEKLLFDGGTTILKFMLHISKEEQKERLEDRLADPERHWKFAKADLDERKRWDDYQMAYEEALIETATDYAPWYVIPADRKWFRNYCISSITREHMESLGMQYPDPEKGLEDIVVV